MKRIGITTTVPVEVLLAAGYVPVDLNNLFIASPDPEWLVSSAERAGFPLNCCSWIKGIYAVSMEQGINTVLVVTTGDCSNTQMLREVLELRGVEVIPFAYPPQPEAAAMEAELHRLARRLGTTLQAAEEVRQVLLPIRRRLARLDELTWREGVVRGGENHFWLVSASDFNGSPGEFHRGLAQVLEECGRRAPYPGDMLRLAFIGVPPVYAKDLYPFLESQGARVVFNEVQRQFAMTGPAVSLAEQYSSYTYPYSIRHRIEDIHPQLRLRGVEGVIHYVQAFCHRGIADILFRHHLPLPILTIEGNTDFGLTHHLKTRLEAFIDMLRRSQRLLSQVRR